MRHTASAMLVLPRHLAPLLRPEPHLDVLGTSRPVGRCRPTGSRRPSRRSRRWPRIRAARAACAPSGSWKPGTSGAVPFLWNLTTFLPSAIPVWAGSYASLGDLLLKPWLSDTYTPTEPPITYYVNSDDTWHLDLWWRQRDLGAAARITALELTHRVRGGLRRRAAVRAARGDVHGDAAPGPRRPRAAQAARGRRVGRHRQDLARAGLHRAGRPDLLRGPRLDLPAGVVAQRARRGAPGAQQGGQPGPDGRRGDRLDGAARRRRRAARRAGRGGRQRAVRRDQRGVRAAEARLRRRGLDVGQPRLAGPRHGERRDRRGPALAGDGHPGRRAGRRAAVVRAVDVVPEPHRLPRRPDRRVPGAADGGQPDGHEAARGPPQPAPPGRGRHRRSTRDGRPARSDRGRRRRPRPGRAGGRDRRPDGRARGRWSAWRRSRSRSSGWSPSSRPRSCAPRPACRPRRSRGTWSSPATPAPRRPRWPGCWPGSTPSSACSRTAT